MACLFYMIEYGVGPIREKRKVVNKRKKGE
jgi:hypothetical protein